MNIFAARECRTHKSRHSVDIVSLRAVQELGQVEKHRRNLQAAEQATNTRSDGKLKSIAENRSGVEVNLQWYIWMPSREFFEQMLLLLSGWRVLLTTDTWLRSIGASPPSSFTW